MLKNRELKITVDKKGKPQSAEETIVETKNWEDKTDYVLSKLQSFGKMMFFGVAGYIILDTARQIAVEKAKAN